MSFVKCPIPDVVNLSMSCFGNAVCVQLAADQLPPYKIFVFRRILKKIKDILVEDDFFSPLLQESTPVSSISFL